MKKVYYLLFAIFISLLIFIGIAETSAKYKFKIAKQIDISTEEFYTSVDVPNDPISRDAKDCLYISNVSISNNDGKNYTKVPITYEISIADSDNSTEKFELSIDDESSQNGKLEYTVNEVSSISTVVKNIKLIEKKGILSYSPTEVIKVSVKAIKPYTKDLINEQTITVDMKIDAEIKMDFNCYKVSNVNDILTDISSSNLEIDSDLSLLSGVSIATKSGLNNNIIAAKEILNVTSDVDLYTNGTYDVTYSNKCEMFNIEDNVRKVEVGMTPVKETHNYTGSYETIDNKKLGLMRIELYGAQGGKTKTSDKGGLGGYTSGIVNLCGYSEPIYLYVGEKVTGYTAAFNGGGLGGNSTDGEYSSGGGATDIRLTSGSWDNSKSLASRIMVAGGGGGGEYYGKANVSGGNAGGLVGTEGTAYKAKTSAVAHDAPLPGTQTAGGAGARGVASLSGGFGYGGKATTRYGCGGGGGYYGGGGGRIYVCMR